MCAVFLSLFFIFVCALGGLCVSAGTTGPPQASIHTVRFSSVMSQGASVQPTCEESPGLGEYNYIDWDKSLIFATIIEHKYPFILPIICL